MEVVMSQIGRYVLQQQEAAALEVLIDCNRNERSHENQRINQQNCSYPTSSAAIGTKPVKASGMQIDSCPF
jgi:hypothetical protein